MVVDSEKGIPLEIPEVHRQPNPEGHRQELRREDWHMELEFNQVSVNSVAKWDIWPGIVQIVGRVMTLESISDVLLAALWR